MVGHVPDAQITVKAGNSLTLECLIKDSKPVSQITWFRGHEHLRLDAPGAPEITGYTEGEIVRAGDKKTLTCRARGGNPLPEVFWFKNGVRVQKNFHKFSDYVDNQYTFVVEASDNLAKYECHVINVMTTQPKKAEIQLRVNFAPSTVTIFGPDEAKVGDVISLSCVADNSNPPADVTVVINGQTPPGATSSTQKVEHGGWRTTTNLTVYEVRPTDSDLTINCYALNPPLSSTKIDTKIISVLRPPEPPVILGYELGRLLKKGTPQRLTCVSNGGNPLATLQWFKGSQELPTNTKHDSGTALADLDITLTESDNEAEYRCQATNSATPEPLVNSTVLSVMFPPAAVKVETRPRPLQANTEATLICESSSSNPRANVTWWREGFEVQPGESQISPGQFGGTTTKYSVKVDVTAEDDGAVFTCQADNRFGSTTHDAVTLSVQYPPVWMKEPQDMVDVTEGENVMVNVSAHGNPNGVAYLWRRGEEVVMAGSLLNITSVTKDQAGVYTVEASNSQGSSAKNVTINVKYGAIITSISGGRNLSMGTNVTLVCRVDASPDPDVHWRREGYDFARTEHKKHPSKNVTTADTGVFTCHAKNDIGDEAVANTTIVVKHKPVIDQSPKYQKAAAESGRNARLTCRASGAPYVHFTWFTRDNTPIEPAVYSVFKNRYVVEDSKLVDGLVTYESVLLVKNVTNKDYGFFECQARNPLGSSRTAIHLDGTSKPDTPLDLKYTDVYPANVTTFTVTGLSLGTSYSFNVLAFNNKGQSDFTKDEVKATTSSESHL
ncbi:Synaptogenesis protein syg-2-like 7, partial [Homarus americanus]